MGSNTQINLDYEQLVHCVKYNILFFCEHNVFGKNKAMNTLVKVPFTQNQNVKMIQQKCTIEYYPKLDPDPEILDAGNYLLLGNFPLSWNYFCKQKDEIPSPISGSSYVIRKKHDFMSMLDSRIMVSRGQTLPTVLKIQMIPVHI